MDRGSGGGGGEYAGMRLDFVLVPDPDPVVDEGFGERSGSKSRLFHPPVYGR